MKEKFLEYVDDCSITSDYARENAEHCVEICEQFAIDFAYWITDSQNKNVKGQISIEKLLEIYKKEID